MGRRQQQARHTTPFIASRSKLLEKQAEWKWEPNTTCLKGAALSCLRLRHLGKA
jgi:hypothetical protein